MRDSHFSRIQHVALMRKSRARRVQPRLNESEKGECNGTKSRAPGRAEVTWSIMSQKTLLAGAYAWKRWRQHTASVRWSLHAQHQLNPIPQISDMI